MSALFISLYLDEDVAILVAALVRARGFVAYTTVEADRLHATDEEQLQYAIQRQAALLTHNRTDFESLHEQCLNTGGHHAGIIIAQRRNRMRSCDGCCAS